VGRPCNYVTQRIAARAIDANHLGMEPLDQLCVALGKWVPFAMPLACFTWMLLRCRDISRLRLLRLVADFVGIALFITARAWYAEPDYAGSPVAAVCSMAVLIAPALLGLACVFFVCTRKGQVGWERAICSLGMGYLILAMCSIPALIVFVELGGDTL
jgi:hypothetical protein